MEGWGPTPHLGVRYGPSRHPVVCPRTDDRTGRSRWLSGACGFETILGRRKVFLRAIAGRVGASDNSSLDIRLDHRDAVAREVVRRE